MKRSLGPTILAFFATGCFYTYNYYGTDAGSSSGGGASTGGSTAATTTGAVTGASASGSSGGEGSTSSGTGTGSSSGGGSTSGGISSSSGGTGGSSTSGSSTGGLCAPPDAGWPIHCGPPIPLAAGAAPIGQISIVPEDGGYLLGVAYASTLSLAFLGVAPDGGLALVPRDVTTDAGSALSLTSPAAGLGPSLFAANMDYASGNFDQLACAQPFDATEHVLSYTYGDGTAWGISQLAAAAAPDGTLACVNFDNYDEPFTLALGPPDGGCPTSVQALPSLNTLDKSLVGGAAPGGVAIVPTGGGEFLVATVWSNPQNSDDLALVSLPSQTEVGPTVIFDQGESYQNSIPEVAISTDGQMVEVIASDLTGGVLLFSADGGATGTPLKQVVSLDQKQGIGLSAASCGPNCMVAGWAEFISSSCPAGTLTFEPTFAVVDGAGCGVILQPFGKLNSDCGWAFPVAVAASGQHAVLAYAVTSNGSTQLFATLCAP